MNAPAETGTLHDLLRSQAARSPGATAVEDCYGNALTYRELDALSTRIASRLHAVGVRRGDCVGVCMPKCVNAVASIYGALKAGAAYVPTDYSSPPKRNRLIYTNCQAKVIFTDEARAPSFEEDGRPIAPLLVYPGEATSGVGADWVRDTRESWTNDDPPGTGDLAYILYTSGSTGIPKGVMHSHSSALSFVNWAARTLGAKPEDRFSSHAPFHFDLSVLDLYVPATAGAAVVVIGENLGKQPHELAGFIADRRITVWYSVPSILSLLVQFGRLQEKDFSLLRTVLFAGEVFPIRHFHELVSVWPDKGYYNLYGPTETNVCTFHKVGPEDRGRETPLPIGRVCANVRAQIVDDSFRPVAEGEEGVLYVHCSGPTMLGYWGDEERTRSCMHTDEHNERWYCTGDVVVPRAGGVLTFVGRRDRMVKRHGYRIELGEIEAGLHTHKGVDEVAAVAAESPQGVAITAYLSMKKGETAPSIIALKQYCAKALPAYMSPDRFVVLNRLPRTSTDKIDYPELKRRASAPA